MGARTMIGSTCLLPLAYILDDAELIAKVKPWIEWTLASQKEKRAFSGPGYRL